MNLQPIVEFLETQGFGTQGVDLFRESMPDPVLEGLMVTSQTPVVSHRYLPGRFTGQFQVIARSTSRDTPRTRLNAVIDALTGQGQIMGSMQFFYICAAFAPLTYPLSEGSLIEAAVDFDCAFLVLT